MAKRERIRRVVSNNNSNQKNKGHFIRSEYAHTYLLFFFGICAKIQAVLL